MLENFPRILSAELRDNADNRFVFQACGLPHIKMIDVCIGAHLGSQYRKV